MRAIACSFLIASFASAACGQSPDPPISDTRLPVSTLVREDVFAGWRTNDMERYARGEKNIDLLLEQRPAARAECLAWKGGIKLYRGVLALEAGKNEEFERYYQESLDLFAEAKKLAPKYPAVAAIVGGSYVLFADRLPKKYRAAAWSESYDGYHVLWKQQGRSVDRLPEHIRGELLAGLAQSAQRTGHKEEANEYLDKIIELLPDTGYERVAKQWKADPLVAAKSNISCKSCHTAGRLSDRMAKLADLEAK
jgi:tetratricopeptide (TPR) repeat protein